MRRGSFLAAAAIVGALLMLVAPVAADSPRPYVALGGYWIDKNQKYGWAYFAERPGPPEGSGPRGAQRPCITVNSYIREGNSFRLRGSQLCYGMPHFLTAKGEPLIVGNVVFSTEEGSATAFGVAAAPAARYLRIVFDDGRRTIRLRELNRAQARKIRLRPFRHAGFVIRGEYCIEQILVLNKEENTLWDSGSSECPPDEAARLGGGWLLPSGTRTIDRSKLAIVPSTARAAIQDDVGSAVSLP